MLQVITLYTIEKIFEHIKVSTRGRLVYLSCLIDHFRELESTQENAGAFEKSKTELKYDTFKNSFNELNNMQIIEVLEDTVKFNNMWGKHINWDGLKMGDNKLEKKSISTTDAKNIIMESERTRELLGMKYRVKAVQYQEMVMLFLATTEFEKYKHEGALLSHFIHWSEKKLSSGTVHRSVEKNKRRLGND